MTFLRAQPSAESRLIICNFYKIWESFNFKVLAHFLTKWRVKKSDRFFHGNLQMIPTLFRSSLFGWSLNFNEVIKPRVRMRFWQSSDQDQAFWFFGTMWLSDIWDHAKNCSILLLPKSLVCCFDWWLHNNRTIFVNSASIIVGVATSKVRWS